MFGGLLCSLAIDHCHVDLEKNWLLHARLFRHKLLTNCKCHQLTCLALMCNVGEEQRTHADKMQTQFLLKGAFPLFCFREKL